MNFQRRSDYSRRLVTDLLALVDDGAGDGVVTLDPDERAALFAAARDYAALVPETCTRCGRELPYLQPEDPSEYSYAKGLRLVATGGYGMFIDPMMDGNPEILLCHECAHAICAAMPWLAAAIDASFGHSDGSTEDPGETAAWPTLEEAGAILGREPSSLLAYADQLVATRDSLARIRPAVMIELARADAKRPVGQVASEVLDLAYERAPQYGPAVDAEIEACFIETRGQTRFNPESAAAFLAAVRRISPEWGDRLDVIYRDALPPSDPDATDAV
jgi:hypothetical protein